MATGSTQAADAAAELVVSRIFEAPRGAVFSAWTEPEAFGAWFGPHGSTLPHCQLDAREGGRLHFQHRFPDHEDVWVAGTFEEVRAPELLAFTTHFSDASGARRERAGFPSEMRIAVAFEALAADRTRVTVRQSGLVRDQGEGQGWLEAFERLAVELAHMGGGLTGAGTFLYPPNEPTIIFRRHFRAPPALVWEAMTRPEHMRAWWGPRGYVNTECELDVQPGGAWRMTQHGPDGGGPYRFHGEFLEVSAPDRLVLTFSFEGMEGEPMVETHTLQATPDGTLLESESRLPSLASRAAMIGSGMEPGAAEAWDRLAEILAALDTPGSDRELILSRVFEAPRELVYRAWTERERLDRWMGPRGYTTRTHSMDARVGGEWRYDMVAPDGTLYPNRVRYEVMDPPERLAYAHDTGEENDPHGFHTEVTFTEEGTHRTRVTMRMRLASRAARDFTIGFGAVELGHQTLQRLAEHLEG